MIGKIVSTVLQCILFVLTFLVGSFLRPFHIQTALVPTATQTRMFVWDGLLLMLILYVLVLVLEVLMKKIKTAGPWTTLALGLATLLGFLMKFGFVSIDRL